MKKKSSDADIYRMRTDIISIFNSMVEGIGEVIQIDTERILLVLSSKTSIKDVILLNQIGLSLQSFFQHGESFPELKAVIKRIPEDGMDAAVILNEIK